MPTVQSWPRLRSMTTTMAARDGGLYPRPMAIG